MAENSNNMDKRSRLKLLMTTDWKYNMPEAIDAN